MARQLPAAAAALADDDDEAWEDEDDEESRAAVDRVLNKYEKAKVMEDDNEGDFDRRYEASIKEKMDEWKRGYSKACGLADLLGYLSDTFYRASWKYHTIIHWRWAI